MAFNSNIPNLRRHPDGNWVLSFDNWDYKANTFYFTPAQRKGQKETAFAKDTVRTFTVRQNISAFLALSAVQIRCIADCKGVSSVCVRNTRK